MGYLDYLLLLILIGLLCVLIYRILPSKEGFGNDKQASIFDASGGNIFNNIFDSLFGLNDNQDNSGEEDVYPEDAYAYDDDVEITQHTADLSIDEKKNSKSSYVGDEKDEKPKPDGNLMLTFKTVYHVARQVSVVLIKMPYKILNNFVDMIIKFIQQFRKIIDPIVSFVRQMFKIFWDNVKKMYDQFIAIVQFWFSIMRNFPEFIRQNFALIISFISQAIERITTLMNSLSDMINMAMQMVINFPMQIFDILDQMTKFGFNMFNMGMKLPVTGMKMMINLQDKVGNIMESGQIPFLPF